MSQSRLLPDISSVIDGFTSVVRSVINAASRTLQPSAAVGTSAVIPFRTGDHAGSDINLPTADVGSPEETVPLRSAEIIQFPVGRWNYGKNGQLRKSVKRGIAAAAAAAPHLADLAERIIPRLPGKPSVSNDLKCAGRKTSSWAELLMYATTRPWISFNTESATNAITIDCDHDNLDLLDDIIYKHGCPPPTFVASDPWSGRFHVTWFLMCPVKTALGANPKPKALLDRARGLLTDALNGDKRFTNRLTKNPFGLKSDLAGSLRRCTPASLLIATVRPNPVQGPPPGNPGSVE